jgi:calcineurin-like phosphoesterase family protein
MSNTFFTADTHFNHNNIIHYCNRPFESMGEMNQVMMDKWNSVVGKKDSVYVLGDFCLGNATVKQWLVDQLNGVIYLVPGSHDHGKNPGMMVLDNIYEHKGWSHPIICCHYPLMTWPGLHYGGIHLFGHCHGRLTPRPQCMDVGVDTNKFYPYALEDIKKIFEKKT